MLRCYVGTQRQLIGARLSNQSSKLRTTQTVVTPIIPLGLLRRAPINSHLVSEYTLLFNAIQNQIKQR